MKQKEEGEKEMLRKPGICQKPVITLYETPAYAACGMAVGAEPTDVAENGGVADEFSLDGSMRY